MATNGNNYYGEVQSNGSIQWGLNGYQNNPAGEGIVFSTDQNGMSYGGNGIELSIDTPGWGINENGSTIKIYTTVNNESVTDPFKVAYDYNTKNSSGYDEYYYNNTYNYSVTNIPGSGCKDFQIGQQGVNQWSSQYTDNNGNKKNTVITYDSGTNAGYNVSNFQACNFLAFAASSVNFAKNSTETLVVESLLAFAIGSFVYS